jgi:hypothetical protein
MLTPLVTDHPCFAPLKLSIIAGGTARLTFPELAKRRKELMDDLPKSLSLQFLRHSDEQTLTSLLAISEAIRSANMARNDFHDWAIVSSSRNLGRSAFAAAVDKYRDEGPWGVSVHVIPHCTAHSVAGTISLALESHGPCIGAGLENDSDALLAAACILQRPNWFGAWVVFSAWSPELAIDATGRPNSESMCLAAAIAVTKDWSACSIGRISLVDAVSANADAIRDRKHEALSPSFMEFLTNGEGIDRVWTSAPSRAIHIHVELNGRSWCERDYRSRENAQEACDSFRRYAG